MIKATKIQEQQQKTNQNILTFENFSLPFGYPEEAKNLTAVIESLPDSLQYITGTVETNEECYNIMELDLYQQNNMMNKQIPDHLLCINYSSGNACPGDSGGPLVTKPEEHDGVTPGQNYEQIGVVSFGLNRSVCSSSGWSVYGRVTTILEWIESSVGKGHTECGRE